MTYDEVLAHRIRELLAGERGLSEVSMFGGLAFLLDGNMAVAASGKGGLMLRIDPDASARALAREHASPMIMRGRPAKGWIRVGGEGLKTKRQLASWVRLGVEYARTLPAKG